MNDRDKMANDFLRLHDKDYTRKDRVKRTDRPYLTDRQLQLRRSREIPASSLYNRAMAQRFGVVELTQNFRGRLANDADELKV